MKDKRQKIADTCQKNCLVQGQEESEKRLKRKKLSKILSIICYFIVIPMVVVGGIVLLNDRQYTILSLMIAIISCIPFFISFEKGKKNERELVIIAVMTALSAVGRIIFLPLPGFKPITAIVIITAAAFGAEAGFLTGSLTAILYPPGPWTPFQMFSWGMIGFISGLLLQKKEKPNRVLMIILGIVSAVLFTFIMDLWTTVAIDNTFVWTRYVAALLKGAPFLAIYIVSNVVFLTVLTKPFMNKFNRIKKKFGVFKS